MPQRVSQVLAASVDSGGARGLLKQTDNDSKSVLAIML
jgi:hypothetical protein